MKYFREAENPTARLPADFMQGFLEVGIVITALKSSIVKHWVNRVATEIPASEAHPIMYGICSE